MKDTCRHHTSGWVGVGGQTAAVTERGIVGNQSSTEMKTPDVSSKCLMVVEGHETCGSESYIFSESSNLCTDGWTLYF